MDVHFEDIDGACYFSLAVSEEELDRLLAKKTRMIGVTDVFDETRYYFDIKLQKEE